jgi:hypothetical protein
MQVFAILALNVPHHSTKRHPILSLRGDQILDYRRDPLTSHVCTIAHYVVGLPQLQEINSCLIALTTLLMVA